MRSGAATVADYLEEVPAEQRPLIEELRALLRETLPEGYEEAVRWGMISYEVPLERSGRTYNGKPLMYAAIGAQKRHVGLYLCGLNCRRDLLDGFAARWAEGGRILDMGRACVRLKSADDLDRAAVAEAADMHDDVHGSAAYRKGLAGTLAERALCRAAGVAESELERD